jgi:hypothetical protein
MPIHHHMQQLGIYQKKEGIPCRISIPKIHREFGPLVSSPHVSCHVMQSTNEYYMRNIYNLPNSLDCTTESRHWSSNDDGTGPACKFVDFLSSYFQSARQLINIPKTTLVCEK